MDDTWGSARRSQVYYPTGVRNFLRLTARDDLDGTAQAMLAKQLGLRSVYLLSDPEFRGGAVWTGPFRRQASQLDVRIAGSEAYDGRGGDYRALAARVAHSRADGVFIGGSPWLGGDLLSALRSRLGSRVTIMAAEPFERVPDVLGFSGRAAHGLYVATGNLSPVALDPTPAGRRFTDDFGREAYARYALQTAEATEIVLHAIAHSDGTRASVLRQLRATHVTNGILGSFHFDRNGDITPANVTILRITGTTRPNPDLPSEFQGAILEGVETIRSSAPK